MRTTFMRVTWKSCGKVLFPGIKTNIVYIAYVAFIANICVKAKALREEENGNNGIS